MWWRSMVQIVYLAMLVVAFEGVWVWLGERGRAGVYQVFFADYVAFADFYWHRLPSLSNPYTFLTVIALGVIAGAALIVSTEMIASAVLGYVMAQIALAIAVPGYGGPSANLLGIGALGALALTGAILFRQGGGTAGLREMIYRRIS